MAINTFGVNGELVQVADVTDDGERVTVRCDREMTERILVLCGTASRVYDIGYKTAEGGGFVVGASRLLAASFTDTGCALTFGWLPDVGAVAPVPNRLNVA